MSTDEIERHGSPDQSTTKDEDGPLLEVDSLKTHFPVNTGLISSITLDRDSGFIPLTIDDSTVKAVDGVSFTVDRGKTLGIVGESGCGKSTLARTILGLDAATSGTIKFDGVSIDKIDQEDFRKRTSMVFQDPQASLNPRRRVGKIIEDPLEGAGWQKEDRRARALDLLEDVGLEREYYNRYPHEFSGGQRQRINLARALSINPDLVVADEPVSGLDVSVQAQILKLMDRLQDEFNLTYLFISHDLSVIRYVADRVAVMYLGKLVEVAPSDELFTKQYHPYAEALLGAVPNPDPDKPGVRAQISGDIPNASDPPRGCRFHTRCPEFIVPEGFSREGYEAIAGLLQSLRTHELDTSSRSADAIVEDYVADDTIPPACRTDAREAVQSALVGEWEEAEAVLVEYESPCQRQEPLLESVGQPKHRAACHLSFGNPIGTGTE